MSKESLANTENTTRDVIYELEGTQFVWDSTKYQLNYQKHNITFEEAATLFFR